MEKQTKRSPLSSGWDFHTAKNARFSLLFPAKISEQSLNQDRIMVKIKWKRSKIILFQTENKIILLTPLADYLACSKTLLWLLLDLRIARYFGWKRDKKNLSKKSIFCSARCWPIKVVRDLVGRDVMGLNGFKGANTRHVFVVVGVGCGSVRLGDGVGNEVIDQWESEQIGGLAHRVYVAFAFCCTFWCFPALNLLQTQAKSCCISPDLSIISKANKKRKVHTLISASRPSNLHGHFQDCAMHDFNWSRLA